jgi:hypothetical protein
MKRSVDLDKAAEGELFGALAVGPRKHRAAADSGGLLTSAQKHAAASLASSLVEFAREAGAEGRTIPLGDLLLELRQDGSEEVLSIRKALAH